MLEPQLAGPCGKGLGEVLAQPRHQREAQASFAQRRRERGEDAACERALGAGASDREDDERRLGRGCDRRRRQRPRQLRRMCGPEALLRIEAGKPRSEVRPQRRQLLAAEQLDRQREAGQRDSIRRDPVRDQPADHAAARREIADAALRRIVRDPDPVAVGVGHQADRGQAGGIGDQRRRVERGEQRRAALSQVVHECPAEPSVDQLAQPSRGERRSRKIAPGLQPRDLRVRVHQRQERRAHDRPLRSARQPFVEAARAPPTQGVPGVSDGSAIQLEQRQAEQIRERLGGAQVAVAHVDGDQGEHVVSSSSPTGHARHQREPTRSATGLASVTGFATRWRGQPARGALV